MSPLAQRLLNAYDSRDRDMLQRAVAEVDKLVLRQRLPAPGPMRCTCHGPRSDDSDHERGCELFPWQGGQR